jgi:hypothetical protein
MDLKKTYGFDQEKASEGGWVDLPSGGRVRVCKLGTLEYQQAINRASRKYLAKIRTNTLSAEEANAIACAALSEAIVRDWAEIEEEGTLVPFSKVNARRLLSTYSGFKDDVETVAGDPENFQEDDEGGRESDTKNSLTTSSGSSVSGSDAPTFS